jgi:hypothetical protein
MRIHHTPLSIKQLLSRRRVSRASAASLPEGDNVASLRGDDTIYASRRVLRRRALSRTPRA